MGLLAFPRPRGAQPVHDRHRVDEPLAGQRPGGGYHRLTGRKSGADRGVLGI